MPANDAKTFAFTKSKLEKLQPPRAVAGAVTTSKELYYDAGCSCLALRVTSSGAKSFVAYRWDPKKKRTDRTTLGRFSTDAFRSADFDKNPLSFVGTNALLTIDMARDMATAVIGSQQNFKEQRRTENGELSLQELFEEYMTRHVEKSRKTGEETRKNFERNLGHWSKRKLSSITQTECEELHGKLGKGKGIYAANRCIQMLRAIFNKGKSWKLFLGENPAQGISLFKEKARERFLSEDEIGKLFAALAEAPQDTKDLVYLSLYTAARKMNACGMRWQDVNLREQLWTIPDTKSGGSQTISLTAQEVELLEDRKKYLARNGRLGIYVFPSKSKTGHLLDPKKSWTTVRKNAGVDDLHFHDLRRSLGAWMASGNANLALIKGALGHKDMKTTMNVYARTKKDAEREAREDAHRKMHEAAKKRPSNENVVIIKKASEK